MQNVIQKFGQSSIVFKKPAILSKNLKILMSFNYPTVQYFLLKLRTHFLLTNVCKRMYEIFFILFRSWAICKELKRSGIYTRWYLRFLHFLLITQDLGKIKKNPEQLFVDIIKQKTGAKFQQKMWSYMVVGLCQIFWFFRQKTWFLGNNRSLP